jgi:SAM-dependent methyltransferase
MSFEQEVRDGERFEFGANWSRFLKLLDDDKIVQAEESLKAWHGVDSFEGKTFLDIGSGSGLFSLAARRLGAHVTSFDYDPNSVACTTELRRRYFEDDSHWQVHRGSALDREWMETLGTFDIVYSWGVLHHTGDQWTAIANARAKVKPGGVVHLALYNDQGRTSTTWTRVKRAYLKAPRPISNLILYVSFARLWGPTLLRDVFKGKPGASYRNYGTGAAGAGRGMTPWIDMVDWVGGYPFEVSKPEEVFDFFREEGFSLRKMRTCGGGLGCNEFIFDAA